MISYKTGCMKDANVVTVALETMSLVNENK